MATHPSSVKPRNVVLTNGRLGVVGGKEEKDVDATVSELACRNCLGVSSRGVHLVLPRLASCLLWRTIIGLAIAHEWGCGHKEDPKRKSEITSAVEEGGD